MFLGGKGSKKTTQRGGGRKEWVGMDLRILNLEKYQNCMIGSKVKTILTMYFSHG